MDATRIIVAVHEQDAEAVAARLLEDGWAFEQRDRTTLNPPPAGEVHFVIWCDPARRDTAPSEIQAAIGAMGLSSTVSSTVLDGDQYRDTWKQYFKARAVGPFVIVPSWEQYEAAPGETLLRLDPGRAFGTGGHASTRLCLRAIGRLHQCRRFLDVGCGSGILAIAAALRWPDARGVAVDTDPEALEVTRENAAQNGVGERIEIAPPSPTTLLDTYDAVFANLTAETILGMVDALSARVAAGGRLIASGILDREAAQVAAALEGAGLRLTATDDEDEWRALTLERPGGTA